MESAPTTHAWTDNLGWVVAIIVALGGGVKWIVGTIRNWKKPGAEITESATRSDLNVAQARHLEIQDNLTAGEFMSRIFQQLMEANRRSDQLLAELESAKKEIGRMAALEAENNLLQAQVQRARAQGFLAENRGQANPAA